MSNRISSEQEGSEPVAITAPSPNEEAQIFYLFNALQRYGLGDNAQIVPPEEELQAMSGQMERAADIEPWTPEEVLYAHYDRILRYLRYIVGQGEAATFELVENNKAIYTRGVDYFLRHFSAVRAGRAGLWRAMNIVGAKGSGKSTLIQEIHKAALGLAKPDPDGVALANKDDHAGITEMGVQAGPVASIVIRFNTFQPTGSTWTSSPEGVTDPEDPTAPYQLDVVCEARGVEPTPYYEIDDRAVKLAHSILIGIASHLRDSRILQTTPENTLDVAAYSVELRALITEAGRQNQSAIVISLDDVGEIRPEMIAALDEYVLTPLLQTERVYIIYAGQRYAGWFNSILRVETARGALTSDPLPGSAQVARIVSNIRKTYPTNKYWQPKLGENPLNLSDYQIASAATAALLAQEYPGLTILIASKLAITGTESRDDLQHILAECVAAIQAFLQDQLSKIPKEKTQQLSDLLLAVSMLDYPNQAQAKAMAQILADLQIISTSASSAIGWVINQTLLDAGLIDLRWRTEDGDPTFYFHVDEAVQAAMLALLTLQVDPELVNQAHLRMRDLNLNWATQYPTSASYYVARAQFHHNQLLVDPATGEIPQEPDWGKYLPTLPPAS